MMLAVDISKLIANRLQKVLVGGLNGAVHLELDHGLRLADRGELTSEIELEADLFRDHLPRHHRSEIVALLVVKSGDEQIENLFAEFDFRPVRQILRIAQ